MNDKYFEIKDIHGNIVIIDIKTLQDELKDQGFNVFGMGLREILEFRKQYQLRRGLMPITKEKIIEIFQEGS